MVMFKAERDAAFTTLQPYHESLAQTECALDLKNSVFADLQQFGGRHLDEHLKYKINRQIEHTFSDWRGRYWLCHGLQNKAVFNHVDFYDSSGTYVVTMSTMFMRLLVGQVPNLNLWHMPRDEAEIRNLLVLHELRNL